MVEMTITEIHPVDITGNGDWQERAVCQRTDPEAFFPEPGEAVRPAKRVCAGCEVRVDCLAYALANDERFGVWGGLTASERRRRYPRVQP
ncbi:transcription factor WhiB [Rhodococcus sp. D-1]|nr:transcription factor WhiB [Rhodococcus sp. D-1]